MFYSCFHFMFIFFRNFINKKKHRKKKQRITYKSKNMFPLPLTNFQLWFLNFLQIFPESTFISNVNWRILLNFYWLWFIVFVCESSWMKHFKQLNSFICLSQHCLCRIRTKRIILNMYLFLLLYLYLIFWYCSGAFFEHRHFSFCCQLRNVFNDQKYKNIGQ